MVRALIAVLGIAGICSTSLAETILEVDLQLVSEVGRSDVSEGHLFHANRLWVGHARSASHQSHRIEVYTKDGSHLEQTIELSHSITGIYPHGEAVIVVGRSASPRWLTHYTEISRQQARWQTQTRTFPERYQVHEFAGDHRQLYFNEPGSRAVFHLHPGSRALQTMPLSVSGPGKMAVDQHYLWVIENNAFGFGDENLVRIDRRSFQIERTFTDYYRNGLVELLALPAYDLVAVSEAFAGNVLLIDARSNQLLHTLDLGGSPRGLAKLGRCLVTANSSKQAIQFIDLMADHLEVVFSWDLSRIEQHLTAPRKLAIDESSGSVFVRSTHPCPSCAVSQSSVYRATDPSREVLAFCMQHRTNK